MNGTGGGVFAGIIFIYIQYSYIYSACEEHPSRRVYFLCVCVYFISSKTEKKNAHSHHRSQFKSSINIRINFLIQIVVAARAPHRKQMYIRRWQADCIAASLYSHHPPTPKYIHTYMLQIYTKFIP